LLLLALASVDRARSRQTADATTEITIEWREDHTRAISPDRGSRVLVGASSSRVVAGDAGASSAGGEIGRRTVTGDLRSRKE
jgi:hypothetical protein